jgi:outer membrane protein TolC
MGLSARRALAEARLLRGPSATLSATLGLDQTAADFSDAYRNPLDHQQVALQIAVPIWQWGASKAQVEAARADYDYQRRQEDLLRREIAQETLYAARRMRIARSQLELAIKADSVATKRFDVAKNRYVVGRIGIADLYLAQSEKDEALQAYVQSLRSYWLAYYELRRLTLFDFEEGKSIPGTED